MSHCAFLVEVALRQRMFACGVGVFAVRTNAPERFLRSKVQKGMLILNLDVPYLCSFNFEEHELDILGKSWENVVHPSCESRRLPKRRLGA